MRRATFASLLGLGLVLFHGRAQAEWFEETATSKDAKARVKSVVKKTSADLRQMVAGTALETDVEVELRRVVAKLTRADDGVRTKARSSSKSAFIETEHGPHSTNLSRVSAYDYPGSPSGHGVEVQFGEADGREWKNSGPQAAIQVTRQASRFDPEGRISVKEQEGSGHTLDLWSLGKSRSGKSWLVAKTRDYKTYRQNPIERAYLVRGRMKLRVPTALANGLIDRRPTAPTR